jgi:hypothetical protein
LVAVEEVQMELMRWAEVPEEELVHQVAVE